MTELVVLSRIVSPFVADVLLTMSSAPPEDWSVLSYAACSVVELDAPATVQALPLHIIVAVEFWRIEVRLPVPPPLTDSVKSLDPVAALT